MSQRNNKCLSIAHAIGLILAVFSINAAAEVCCPAGCVQDANRCVKTGSTPLACSPVACVIGGSSNTGHSGTGATISTSIFPVQPYPRQHPRICHMKGDRPPPGSYHKTCPSVAFRCSNDEDTLIAECKSGAGLKKSELPGASTCANVENKNGKLICRKWKRYVSEG